MTAELDSACGNGKRIRRNQSQSNFFLEELEDDEEVRNISPPTEDNFARIRQNDKHFSKLDLENSHADAYIQRPRQGSDDCSTKSMNTANTSSTDGKPDGSTERTVRRFFKYDYGWFVPVDR